MQLSILDCQKNPITNIEPLRGMPLTELLLNDCPVTSLQGLQECQELEKLTIPVQCQDIEFLKAMPQLRYLNTKWDNAKQTADEFWRKYEEKKTREERR